MPTLKLSELEIALPSKSIGGRDRRWIFASFFLFSLLSVFWFIKSPAVSRGVAWFDDGGFLLNTAQQILNGKQLYSDLFYQYGPIPVESYVLWSKLAGNSITALYEFSFFLYLAALLLFFKAVQKTNLSASALAITLALITLSPLIALNVLDNALYPTCEQILILAVVIIWEPPQRRTVWRGVALGLLIGLMQWVKFGGASGPLAAIFILDLIVGNLSIRSLLKATTP